MNDDAYANAANIPGAAEYPAFWQAEARRFRTHASGRPGLAYGPGERQRLDLFEPASTPRGLVVFLHGGFWRAFGRETWSHLAAGPVARGWAVAVPSYTLAPAARIGQITCEAARAIEVAAAEVAGPIHLVGHSAGGHLVARMLCGDVSLGVADRLQSCVPISPLADLRPLLETPMNADLRLDAEEAAAESPALLRKARAVPVTVWVGGDELPAFLEQARLLATAWDATLVVEPGRHHFDVIASLARPDGALCTAVLQP